MDEWKTAQALAFEEAAKEYARQQPKGNYAEHDDDPIDDISAPGKPKLHMQVADFIKNRSTLFHDSDEGCYARYRVKDHYEVHALDSYGFQKYASYVAFNQFGQALSSEAMKSVVNILSAAATFDGEQRMVSRRVAHRSDVYYIDLCDRDWRVIEVVPGKGWSILESDRNVVLFVRGRNSMALPEPKSGGKIDHLWRYMNVSPADRIRVVTWILDCFRPETQYPVLSLKAVSGSGKTETVNTIRLLTDPNKALTTREPTSNRDVISNAAHNHVLAFDNMSHITDALSDLLCCMATGSGHRERRYYTNVDEVVVELKRPVMFDGIEFLATRDDLVDRLIHVELPALKPNKRVSESRLTAQRDADLPFLLGAVLDLFIEATGHLRTMGAAAQGVRMMDYARLGQAVCDALGKKQDFVEELRVHQQQLKHRVMGDSPFVTLLVEVITTAMEGKPHDRVNLDVWVGADAVWTIDGAVEFRQFPGKLLDSMHAEAKQRGIRTGSWPQKPNGVIGALERHKTALNDIGLTWEKLPKTNQGVPYLFRLGSGEKSR